MTSVRLIRLRPVDDPPPELPLLALPLELQPASARPPAARPPAMNPRLLMAAWIRSAGWLFFMYPALRSCVRIALFTLIGAVARRPEVHRPASSGRRCSCRSG